MIEVWDLKEKEIKQKHILQGHQSIVHAVICTDNKIISGSDDKTIKVSFFSLNLSFFFNRCFKMKIHLCVKINGKVWSQETWKCLHTIPLNKIACALTFYAGNLFAGCYRCIKVVFFFLTIII